MTLTIINQGKPASGQFWERLPAPAKVVVLGGVLVAALVCFKKYEDLAEAPLISPWDANRITQSEVPYACPLDDTNLQHPSSVAPKRVDQSGVLSEAGVDTLVRYVTSAEAAADSYLSTGSSAASRCALRLLNEGSAEGDMLSNQDMRIQHLEAGALSVVMLKVRTSREFGEHNEEVKSINAWLRRLLAPTIAFYDEADRPLNAEQVWAAYDIMAFSILTSDGSLYERASNLLNQTLWSVAPTLNSRQPSSTHSLHCDRLLSAVVPAALAFALQASSGLPTAKRQGNLLRQATLECLAHQGAQPPTVAVSQAHYLQQSTSWLSPYLTTLPSPLSSAELTTGVGTSVWIGGSLP